MSIKCVLPWIHLATHPEGTVSLCCISDHTNNMSSAQNLKNGGNIVLNLNSDTIDNVINSDLFNNTRIAMINGIKPASCQRCYQEESHTGYSKRILENSKFIIDDYEAITNNDGTITPNFRFIELRLGNVCNVKCRTCNPSSSTQWISEYSKLQNELPFVTNYENKLNAKWIHNDAFWNELLAHSADLELIYINGGEPTLVEKHWTYLERLIDANLHKQITLWYNINMTNLPDSLINIWKKFKKVIIHASIDDIGERNSYIRKGTNWHDVEENILKLKSLPWIHTEITQTVSWLNVYYIPEFKDYFSQHNLLSHVNLVYDPIFLNAGIIPKSAKEKLLSKLNGQKFNWLTTIMKHNTDLEKFKEGIAYNNWLDTYRKERYQEHFSEWADILGYNNYE